MSLFTQGKRGPSIWQGKNLQEGIEKGKVLEWMVVEVDIK